MSLLLIGRILPVDEALLAFENVRMCPCRRGVEGGGAWIGLVLVVVTWPEELVTMRLSIESLSESESMALMSEDIVGILLLTDKRSIEMLSLTQNVNKSFLR